MAPFYALAPDPSPPPPFHFSLFADALVVREVEMRQRAVAAQGLGDCLGALVADVARALRDVRSSRSLWTGETGRLR